MIYAKAKPREPKISALDTRAPVTRGPETAFEQTVPPPHDVPGDSGSLLRLPPLDKRQKQLLAAAVAISFLAGYFAGREHIKYEIRSALQDTAAGLKGLFGGNPKSETSKPKVTKSNKTSPVSAKLLRKGTREGEFGRSSITFAISFANSSGKSIRAFDGTLMFTDLLGNEIHGAKLAVNDPISAGGVLEWEGKLDYNQFISSHERLRNSEIENTKAVFVLKKVLFEDGEVKEYEQ